MPRRILIVTNRDDLHADLVAEVLTRTGRPAFRLNLDEFPARYSLAADFHEGDWRGRIDRLTDGDTLDLGEVGAVWMRKKGEFSFLSEDLGAQELAYARAETEHMLFSLLYGLKCAWMSHPRAVRGAIWKGEQLQRAARMGFATPPSLMTNRREAVDSFRSRNADDIAFKPLSSPTLSAEEVEADERVAGVLPTTRITAEHDRALDAVAETPCFFQRYVHKAHELRVTVIGEAVFAAKLHTQDDPRTAVDSRDMSADIRYEAARLEPELEDRCRTFVHSYGLTYGALDLIVTPEGETVFLENNPVGQYLYVEQLVPGLAMTAEVARWLDQSARSEPAAWT